MPKVKILRPRTLVARRTISRFTKVAYSGRFRRDGKLIAAGGEEPIVTVVNVEKEMLVRQFKGHRRAIHAALFSPNNIHVISASDDGTVRGWDLATEEPVVMMQGHTDYVRSADVSSSTPDVWVTGSYDHSVRLWDAREGKSVMTLVHGSPVNSLVAHPNGGIVVAAAENQLRIWDVVGGGRCLHTLTNHRKPITSICYDGTYSRLLTAGLDAQVKVYDVASFSVVNTITHESPILALAVSPDSTHYAVAATDKSVTVRFRKPLPKPHQAPAEPAPGSYRYFARGQGSLPAKGDFTVQPETRPKLKSYDVMLKQFRHGDALEAALESNNPVVVVSMLDELMQRGALESALNGRNQSAQIPLLSFTVRHFNNPRYSSLLLPVAQILLRLCSDLLGTPELDELLCRLKDRLGDEIHLQKELFKLSGSLDVVFASATESGGDDEGLKRRRVEAVKSL